MQLGMIGLGRMGANMTRRLTRGGHAVTVFDLSTERIEELVAEGATGAASIDDLVRALAPPCRVWLMVPAGAPTEQMVCELSTRLQPGNTIIDGGNTYYKDDVRRARTLESRGIHYVDIGTSGGLWGLDRGYSLMIGGPRAAVDQLDPVFATLAPGADGTTPTPVRERRGGTAGRGYLHCGPAGAGHFVKMVHNGIEYGLMQAYAEGFDILRTAANGPRPDAERYRFDLADIAEVWRHGSVVGSWLLDLTAMALAEDPELSAFSGVVQDSGEGRWTIEAAIEQAVPVDVLGASLFARFRSQQDHTFGEQVLSAMRYKFGGHVERPTGGRAVNPEAIVERTVQTPGGEVAVERPVRAADPATMVIFGATGDLAKRKLLPARYNLNGDRLLPERFAVVALGRDSMTTDAYREKVSRDLQEFGPVTTKRIQCEWLESRLSYLPSHFSDPAAYERLRETLGAVTAADGRRPPNYLFYLATPPSLFGPIAERLSAEGLLAEDGGWRRVIIEKPFGHDLDSARALNRRLAGLLNEHQIYRIDHYLGKETVQNIMAFRFANGIFEPIWNRRCIDHVQITAAETVAVEQRGRYYDRAGALRDMVQNHLFQLLALIAMEPPISFKADAVRDERLKVLRSIGPLSASDGAVVRAQYDTGQGGSPRAYREEPDVAPDSRTETYVALKVLVDNGRWADVPFYLRTGKRLPVRATELVIQFKRAPFVLFRETRWSAYSRISSCCVFNPTKALRCASRRRCRARACASGR